MYFRRPGHPRSGDPWLSVLRSPGVWHVRNLHPSGSAPRQDRCACLNLHLLQCWPRPSGPLRRLQTGEGGLVACGRFQGCNGQILWVRTNRSQKPFSNRPSVAAGHGRAGRSRLIMAFSRCASSIFSDPGPGVLPLPRGGGPTRNEEWEVSRCQFYCSGAPG